MQSVTTAISALPRALVSEWRELHSVDDDAAPLPLDWRTLPRWTPEHREAVAVALHDWALSQSDAKDVLRAIAASDRRVGVWLACAVARTALRLVPAGEDRPRIAIETAERWVRGTATEQECRDAADAAYANADAAYAAAYAAANAADAAAYAAYAAANAAANAAAWREARARRLRDLCQTIALATRDAIDAAAEGYARCAKRAACKYTVSPFSQENPLRPTREVRSEAMRETKTAVEER